MTRTKPEPRTEGVVVSTGLYRYLYVTAAVAGAAIMIVEILGARMLAPYVGTSHFVWTAQISVTLVALALGYAVGGWLADRSGRLRWVYLAMLAAAIWLAGVTLACEPVAFACLRFRLAAGSLLAALALFLIPLAALAMVGPLLVKFMTRSVTDVGWNVGRLSALSTAGSVAGTVLISYVLIPYWPNAVTMVVTAGMLVLLTVLYFVIWEPRLRGMAVTGGVLMVLVGFVGIGQRPFGAMQGMKEQARVNSSFGLLQVVENEWGTRRYFLHDLVTQNGYEPRSQRSASMFTYVLYGLARGYTSELRDALCIGMGIGIVPRQLAHDGVRVDVVEINPEVPRIAQHFFDFDTNQVRLYPGDGRYFLRTTTNQYDAVVLDAFVGESSPAHLMTQEAFAEMRRCLRPGGVLVINSFGDFTPGRDFFVSSLARTLEAVFGSVRIHAAHSGNVFFVASSEADLQVRRPVDFSDAPDAVRAAAEGAYAGQREVAPGRGQVLTDGFNPVEFFDAGNREELRRRLAFSYHRP